MTDTVKQVAEKTTNFFKNNRFVKLFTQGAIACSALGLTACGTMGMSDQQQSGTYIGVTRSAEAPKTQTVMVVEAPQAVQTQVAQAQPAQTVMVVQAQPGASYYVNETLNTINNGVTVAGNAVGVINSFKLGDAQAFAIKTNAKANYNSKTINATANLVRAQKQGKAAIIRANKQGDAAIIRAENSGNKKFNPKKQSSSNRGKTKVHQQRAQRGQRGR